jgi:single-stranded DNA-binding protein
MRIANSYKIELEDRYKQDGLVIGNLSIDLEDKQVKNDNSIVCTLLITYTRTTTTEDSDSRQVDYENISVKGFIFTAQD